MKQRGTIFTSNHINTLEFRFAMFFSIFQVCSSLQLHVWIPGIEFQSMEVVRVNFAQRETFID